MEWKANRVRTGIDRIPKVANPSHRTFEYSVKVVVGQQIEGGWEAVEMKCSQERLEQRGSIRMRMAVSRRIIPIAVPGWFFGLSIIITIIIIVTIVVTIAVTVVSVEIMTAVVRPVMSVPVFGRISMSTIGPVKGTVIVVSSVRK